MGSEPGDVPGAPHQVGMGDPHLCQRRVPRVEDGGPEPGIDGDLWRAQWWCRQGTGEVTTGLAPA